MPVVSLKMFPPEVNSLDHPPIVEMRRTLAAMAEDYGTTLKTFAIDHGVVLFSVDSERMAADFCGFIAEATGRPAEVVMDDASFWKRTQTVLDGARGVDRKA